jgi:hypothetical protein
MAFEKFVSSFPHLTMMLDVPTLSYYHSVRALVISRGTFQRLGLDHQKACILYFDPEARRIGLEFIDEPQRGALTLGPARGADNKEEMSRRKVHIKCNDFFQKYDIDGTTIKKLEIKKEGRMYVVQLPEKVA